MDKFSTNQILENIVALHSIQEESDELLFGILEALMAVANCDLGIIDLIKDDKMEARVLSIKSLDLKYTSDDMSNVEPMDFSESAITPRIYGTIDSDYGVCDYDRFTCGRIQELEMLTGYQTQSILSLPLVTRWAKSEEILGVVKLVNPISTITGEPYIFYEGQDLSEIETMSKLAANTIANVMHTNELNDLFTSFISIMTDAIDQRALYNKEHTHKITERCMSFIDYLNDFFEPGHPFYFDAERQQEMHLTCLIHNIGLMYTPIHILNKDTKLGDHIDLTRERFNTKRHQLEIAQLKGELTPEAYTKSCEEVQTLQTLVEELNTNIAPKHKDISQLLTLPLTYINAHGEDVLLLDPAWVEALSLRRGTLTVEEMDIMREHVSHTATVLDSMKGWKYYKNVQKWASDHHELLDGTGYPKGLSGNQIALETSILTMIDIYEAITAPKRAYRKEEGSKLEAINILLEMAENGKLHSELVNLFSQFIYERHVLARY